MSISQNSESEILAGVRSGYTASFEELLRNYEQSVYSLCSLLTRSEAEFERAMCRLTRRIIAEAPKLPEDTELKLWMLKAAVESAVAENETMIHEVDASIEDMDLTVHQGIEAGSATDRLQIAISFLPIEYRLVFILRDVLRLSFPEIAFLSSLTEEDVRACLHRSRFMLRRSMNQEVRACSSTEVLHELPQEAHEKALLM